MIEAGLFEFFVIVPGTLVAIFLWLTGYLWWRARRIAQTGRRRSIVELPAVLVIIVVAAYVLVIAGCGATLSAVPIP